MVLSACVSPQSRLPADCASEDWFQRGLNFSEDVWAIGGEEKRVAFFRAGCGELFDERAYFAGQVAAKRRDGVTVSDPYPFGYGGPVGPYGRPDPWYPGDRGGVRADLPSATPESPPPDPVDPKTQPQPVMDDRD